MQADANDQVAGRAIVGREAALATKLERATVGKVLVEMQDELVALVVWRAGSLERTFGAREMSLDVDTLSLGGAELGARDLDAGDEVGARSTRLWGGRILFEFVEDVAELTHRNTGR